MTQLGKLLRGSREYRGYSLDKVARDAGLSKSHVWGLESGQYPNPTIRTVNSIAGALQVPARRLFDAAVSDLEAADA